MTLLGLNSIFNSEFKKESKTYLVFKVNSNKKKICFTMADFGENKNFKEWNQRNQQNVTK